MIERLMRAIRKWFWIHYPQIAEVRFRGADVLLYTISEGSIHPDRLFDGEEYTYEDFTYDPPRPAIARYINCHNCGASGLRRPWRSFRLDKKAEQFLHFTLEIFPKIPGLSMGLTSRNAIVCGSCWRARAIYYTETLGARTVLGRTASEVTIIDGMASKEMFERTERLNAYLRELIKSSTKGWEAENV